VSPSESEVPHQAGAAREQSPPERTGGELLVDCLLAQGVSLWTCVPGESYLPVLDALYSKAVAGHGPRLITARHEAGAANMAEAAGKLTGRAAVCLVTRGPGATHASIAVHTAFQDGTPMVLVVGQVARAHLGREAFQEMDFSKVFGGSAKAIVTVMEVDRVPEHVARVSHLAHAGRPGPVVLVMPEDVLAEKTNGQVQVAPRPATPSVVQHEAELLLRELAAADRPLIVVGGPGWDQDIADRVRAFGEANSVPIVAAFRWQDAIDNRSSAYAGYLGLGCNQRLRRHIEEADLVVALGPRLDDPTTNGFQLTDSCHRLGVVSEAAEELTTSSVPDFGIHASLDSIVGVLLSRGLPRNPHRERWAAELRAEQERFVTPKESDLDLDVARVIAHVRSQVPDDAIVTNGAGNYTVWVQRFFEFRRYRTQLAPRSGAMGYGLPAGLAAATLAPERTVVTFVGDGCLLMSGSEMATAVQHELRLIVIVVNNSMFGTIRMHQERAFPKRVIATDLTNPDFSAWARSFGAQGSQVRRTEDFTPAFADALAASGPSLIELITDREQITPDLRIDELT